MTPKARLFVGLATTIMLALIGLGFLFEGKGVYAAIVLALGTFRGVMWARELSWYLAADDDDDA